MWVVGALGGGGTPLEAVPPNTVLPVTGLDKGRNTACR